MRLSIQMYLDSLFLFYHHPYCLYLVHRMLHQRPLISLIKEISYRTIFKQQKKTYHLLKLKVDDKLATFNLRTILYSYKSSIFGAFHFTLSTFLSRATLMAIEFLYLS